MADEQQEQFFISIDALQELGISAADLNKIKASGISTVLGVQQATRKSLTKIKGMSDTKVEKLKDAAAKVLPSAFRTGAEVQNHRQSVIMISVGSKQVDSMLGGGVSTQSTTEIYGEFRTGKTQLCHTLCVTCQMDKDDGGAAGKVAYIDTENTFRPDRIKAIAERFGLDGEAALENIVVGRALNSEHQMDLINALAAKFADEGSFKLLIIDSILALFRVDFSGRGELSERQQKLNQMLARLTRISEEFNIAVVYTNHVQADPGASSMFAGAADKKPVGGHVLSHASTTRISLRKARGEERIAKLADSPDQPESEASYKIASGGIADV